LIVFGIKNPKEGALQVDVSHKPLEKKPKTMCECFGNTLWLFNIAMENGPFIDGLPIKNGDFPWLNRLIFGGSTGQRPRAPLGNAQRTLQTKKSTGALLVGRQRRVSGGGPLSTICNGSLGLDCFFLDLGRFL
jgi:hypothetical protein